MMLSKGYGAQSAEEKQRLFKLMRNLNFNGESASESYMPTAQTSGGVAASDGFYSPDFRGDFGAGLLDLHAMDDTELLSEVFFCKKVFYPSGMETSTSTSKIENHGMTIYRNFYFYVNHLSKVLS